MVSRQRLDQDDRRDLRGTQATTPKLEQTRSLAGECADAA
jgi:hypothetical protein